MKTSTLFWAMAIVGISMNLLGAYGIFSGNDQGVLMMAAGTLLLAAGVLIVQRRKNRGEP